MNTGLLCLIDPCCFCRFFFCSAQEDCPDFTVHSKAERKLKLVLAANKLMYDLTHCHWIDFVGNDIRIKHVVITSTGRVWYTASICLNTSSQH